MKVAEIFETMEYGPAPESVEPANEFYNNLISNLIYL